MTKHGKIREFLVNDILKPVEPRRLAARVKALVARSRGRQLAVSA